MFMTHYQNIRQNVSVIFTAFKLYENVGTAITNENDLCSEVQNRINSENYSSHRVQYHLDL